MQTQQMQVRPVRHAADQHQLARTYILFASNMASVAVGGGVALLLGIHLLPDGVPLLGFLQQHPAVLLVVGGVVLASLAVAITLTERRGFEAWRSGRIGLRVLRFVGTRVLSTIASALAGVLLGFSTLPSDIPLLTLIRTHPPVGISLLAVLLGLLILAPLLGPGGGPDDDGANGPWRGASGASGGTAGRLWTATAISAASALLFVTLLATVIARPAWCPSEICPAPELVTNPLGVHDANLDVYPLAVQSATFVIPGDATRYSIAQAGLPRDLGAIRIDDATYPPYRVVIGVHSLQRSGPGLLIRDVAVVLDAVRVPDEPLNVWNPGSDQDYATNPYQAIYRGEPAGATLIAFSTQASRKYTDLREGEGDQIDLQLLATRPAVLQFHVDVTYSLKAGDASLHTLTLSRVYHVAFSTARNWYVYSVQDGQFVPTVS